MSALAFDAAGDLFLADRELNQVWEQTVGGTLVLVAGSGAQGFGGDGGAASAALLDAPEGLAVGGDGTVYIADTGNDRVRAVSGGVIRTLAGTGLGSDLRRPTGLAVDGQGALLVCDTGNARVLRVAGGTETV